MIVSLRLADDGQDGQSVFLSLCRAPVSGADGYASLSPHRSGVPSARCRSRRTPCTSPAHRRRPRVVAEHHGRSAEQALVEPAVQTRRSKMAASPRMVAPIRALLRSKSGPLPAADLSEAFTSWLLMKGWRMVICDTRHSGYPACTGSAECGYDSDCCYRHETLSPVALKLLCEMLYFTVTFRSKESPLPSVLNPQCEAASDRHEFPTHSHSDASCFLQRDELPVAWEVHQLATL